MSEPQGTKLHDLSGSESKSNDAAASPQNSKESKYDLSLNSRSRLLRALFVFLVLVIFGGFLFHLYKQFSKYLYYPVIAVREEALQGVSFPDVAICHLSYIDSDRNFWLNKVNGTNYRELLFEQNLRDIVRLLEFNDTNPAHYNGFRNYSYIPLAKEAFLPFMASSDIGVRVRDFLLSCRYQGQYCDFRNFTNFLHPDHGTCTVFSPKNETTFLSGQGFGLQTKLAIRGKRLIDARLAMTSYVVGFKVFVLPRGTWPDLTSRTVLQQLELLRMEYSYSTLTKLSTPRSPCFSKRLVSLCRLEVKSGLVCRKFLDTASARRAVSKQEELVRTCACISYEWPIPEAMRTTRPCLDIPPAAFVHAGFRRDGDNLIVPSTDNSTTPLRSLLDVASASRRLKCLLSVKAREKEMDVRWNGEKPCYTQTFTRRSVRGRHQFSRFVYDPHVAVINAKVAEMRANLQRQRDLINKTDSDYSMISLFDLDYSSGLFGLEKTSAQLEVFPLAASSLVIKEYYLYDLLFFLADAGGVLGLWVGFSLFTLFEIADWGIGKVMKKREKQT